jgi:phenylpyruvate tautomerase PptA (4-oxalocrotonate tautomerase family)
MVETEMPFVTFTVRRGLSAAEKSSLSEAMLEAQVAAGFHRADLFHRFLEVDPDDLLVDPRFPDYPTDRTDGFMVVEVVLSRGRPTGTAASIADEAVRLFGERLHLAPQDVLFVFNEVEPNLPRFPAASIESRSEKRTLGSTPEADISNGSKGRIPVPFPEMPSSDGLHD